MEYVFNVWTNNELEANDPLPRSVALDAIETYLKEKAKLSDSSGQ